MARKTSKSSDVAELANKAIAKRLRELVTDTTVLAKHLDCSIQAINQYKQGTSQPKIENIIKIAEFYNVSVDYLFGITETKNRDTTIQAVCEETGLSEQAVQNVSLYQKQFYRRKVKEFKDDSRNMIIAQNKFLSSKQYDRFMCEFKNFLQTQTEFVMKRKYAEQNFDREKLEAYKRLEKKFTREEEEELWAQWKFIEETNHLQESEKFRMYVLIESFKEIILKIVQETTDKIEEG